MFDWTLVPRYTEMAKEPQFAEVVRLVDLMAERFALIKARNGDSFCTNDRQFRPDVVITGKHFYERMDAANMIFSAFKALGILSETTKFIDLSSNNKLEFPCGTYRDLANLPCDPVSARTAVLATTGKCPQMEIMIFSGSAEDISNFRKSCAELATYIPTDHWLTLHDYTEEQMSNSIQSELKRRECKLSPEARQSLPILIRQSLKSGCPANNHGVNLLIQNMLSRQAHRLMNTNATKEESQTIEGEDMVGMGSDISGGEALEKTMAELNSMIGLDSVKRRVQELKAVAQVARERAIRGIAAGKSASRHMIFTGNAGTGKTTVARLIARIYYLLGLLENDRVIVASRSDLVAGYLGQTAIKTKEVIHSAMGGILFIDEAYSLYQGHQDSYGMEAIDTLLTEMENNRDRLIVILAGYEKEMHTLMETNQGLSSRFPRTNTIVFPDYSENELVQIYRMIVVQRGQTLVGVTNSELRDLISGHQREGSDFGNARGIRNLVENAERNRDYRIASKLSELTDKEMTQLTKADVLGYVEKPATKKYLDVPYSQKEEAKKAGAKWDPAAKKWYVLYNDGDSLDVFSRWIPEETAKG